MEVFNKMLLNAAKCKGYRFYRFWVTKGKLTEEEIKLHPPPSSSRLGFKRLLAKQLLPFPFRWSFFTLTNLNWCLFFQYNWYPLVYNNSSIFQWSLISMFFQPFLLIMLENAIHVLGNFSLVFWQFSLHYLIDLFC